MTLVLEIEYLSAVAFAAIGPESDLPDWPPQPDRIFSALVATWAARGEREKERQALEWLEKLPVPRLLASQAEPRTSAPVFVPPNDPRSDKQKHARGVLPAMRSRQLRRFPATRPHDSVVRLFWSEAVPEQEILASLQHVARDTAYIGHSSSLTRCRFLFSGDALDLHKGELPDRRIYDGRFAELREAYARFEKSANKKDRPQKGARVAPEPKTKQERKNLFGESWLILEHVAGRMPDIRACALVSKTIRDALLSGYRRTGKEGLIPDVISGHDRYGNPTRAPHLAIVPLSFIGFPYADGHVMGFALVPPSGSAILDDDNFRGALRELAPIVEGYGRRILSIKTKEGTASERAFSIELSPTFEPPANRYSLNPAFYIRRAQIFATVTPIVLDRHLKEKGGARQEEITAQIAGACRNIGLPEPEAVVADKHSALEGAPSAYPSGKSPNWMGWRLPSSLASRQLTHAVIRFATVVDGPVILGAGRFTGLGLCRPLDGEAR
jgi:CRISPR-associated protein Csb2